jgi:hypothetical protein
MDKEKKFNLICFIIFIIITAYPIGYCILYDGILQEIIQRESAINNFCKLNGFNKSTGSNEVGNGFFVRYTQIECDKKEILIWRMESYCSELNKWGECLEEDYIVNREVSELNNDKNKIQ